MKKLIALFVIVLFSVSTIFAQEQTQSKTQKKTQTQVQTGEQSGDPIMTQERIRTNEGKGTVKRVENREMRKQNHGAVVSETAKNADPDGGKGDEVKEQARQKDGTQIHQRDRDQVHKPANSQINRGARPPKPAGMGVPGGVRSGTMNRGGRK